MIPVEQNKEPQINEIMNSEKGDFLLFSGLKNHREHRGHREKWQRSVLSVSSVVDYPYMDSFTQKKLKSL